MWPGRGTTDHRRRLRRPSDGEQGALLGAADAGRLSQGPGSCVVHAVIQ